VQFVVLGVDQDGVESDDDLDEAHQAYMDGWAAALVARGPTEVSDGAGHTGSVHVVQVPNRSIAERFADDEPYHRAGLYRQVSVTAAVPCLDGTMWDRPAPRAGQPATLVIASFDAPGVGAADLAGAVHSQLAETAPWIYVGVTGDDTPGGLLAMVDEDVEQARRLAADLLHAVGIASPKIHAQPWRRGGR
jgi:uncharacterized protein YciI